MRHVQLFHCKKKSLSKRAIKNYTGKLANKSVNQSDTEITERNKNKKLCVTNVEIRKKDEDVRNNVVQSIDYSQ